MSRGPRMTKAVKALIAEETLNNPNKPRELLAVQIQKDIERSGFAVPAEETIVKMVSAIRNPSSDPLKEPWDITVLSFRENETIFNFPTESIPAVLQVWRYSEALDEVLTKRQAKWVSILYPYFKGELKEEIVRLWFQSRRFSREEEISLVTSVSMRLNVLASQLVKNDWETLVTLGSKLLDPSIKRFIQYDDALPTANDGGVMEELLHSIPINIWEAPRDDIEAKHDLYLYNLFREIPSTLIMFPGLPSRLIYLRHLSNMSRGSMWKELTTEQLLQCVEWLRNWMIDWLSKGKNEDAILLFTDIIKAGKLPEHAFPNELYEIAGYTLKEVK